MSSYLHGFIWQGEGACDASRQIGAAKASKNSLEMERQSSNNVGRQTWQGSIKRYIHVYSYTEHPTQLNKNKM